MLSFGIRLFSVPHFSETGESTKCPWEVAVALTVEGEEADP